MNIRIQTEALTSSDNELLREGALYGLKHLLELRHKIQFNAGEMSETQQALLKNEQVSSHSFTSDETDLSVRIENNSLVAYAEDQKAAEAEDWIQLSKLICFPQRKAAHSRSTSETDISVKVNLDGTGKSKIDTGLGFFDHMLEQIARHGLIDLDITCRGDLEIDEHHTIEDTAITLGETILLALGEKVGIQRYAFVLPMDESKCKVALDISGRPYLVFDGDFDRVKVGDFPTEMTEHFFYSLAIHMKSTLHVSFEGKNDHHKIEACFKAFGRCLRAAVSRSERNLNILPSTKDLL
ncbi:MAG: imidazoleglycerol-phosphate dehydratase HisB [Balneolaceae bacterium]|nr:imidazoleglycerol-phosphate dehydratase HisB [Balneolaceae bacterium]